MRKIILLAFELFFCVTAFCDEGWSGKFHFDGNDITDETLLLGPTDPIAYSSAVVNGEPRYITIVVEDKEVPDNAALLFDDSSETYMQGTVCWDYTSNAFANFSADSTYLITETIISDMSLTRLVREVTILPEPFSILAVLSICMLLFRKRIKAFAVFLATLALASVNVRADGIVGDISCLQMWPFKKSVVINYTLNYEDIEPIFEIKFYGSTDDGKTTFDLAKKGTLERDGAYNVISGSGAHQVVWTPDESFRDFVTDDMMIKVEAGKPSGEYLIVDISNGPNVISYPVRYMRGVPEGGWTKKYKTSRLVLRKVDPGVFIMGSPKGEVGRFDFFGGEETQREVTLTKPFYIGIFEVTQKQYELIMGSNPSHFKGDDRPVESVSYEMLRGDGKGSNWPQSNEVDEGSFFEKLRSRTRLVFDLPTEAQWEYACRAGSTSALNNGKNLTYADYCKNMDEVARYEGTQYDGKGGYTEHTTVGSYLPNAWGLYDMHGNVWEHCLDWHLDWWEMGSSDPLTDPLGPKGGKYRVSRSGAYYAPAMYERSAHMSYNPVEETNKYTGFRVVMIPE